MTDSVLAPVYILRAYAWEVLKLNMPDVWDSANYGGMIPLVPVSEEPELSQYDGPHIVYGYATMRSYPLWARNSGSMTFAIYDDNFRRLTQTMTILQAAFEREDEAARDINSWSSTKPAMVGVSFGHISLGFVEGGTPEESEGGRQSALLNIKFDYFADYDVQTQIPT